MTPQRQNRRSCRPRGPSRLRGIKALTCTDAPRSTLASVASCSALRTYAPQSASKVRPPSNLVVGAIVVAKADTHRPPHVLIAGHRERLARRPRR